MKVGKFDDDVLGLFWFFDCIGLIVVGKEICVEMFKCGFGGCDIIWIVVCVLYVYVCNLVVFCYLIFLFCYGV